MNELADAPPRSLRLQRPIVHHDNVARWSRVLDASEACGSLLRARVLIALLTFAAFFAVLALRWPHREALVQAFSAAVAALFEALLAHALLRFGQRARVATSARTGTVVACGLLLLAALLELTVVASRLGLLGFADRQPIVALVLEHLVVVSQIAPLAALAASLPAFGRTIRALGSPPRRARVRSALALLVLATVVVAGTHLAIRRFEPGPVPVLAAIAAALGVVSWAAARYLGVIRYLRDRLYTALEVAALDTTHEWEPVARL